MFMEMPARCCEYHGGKSSSSPSVPTLPGSLSSSSDTATSSQESETDCEGPCDGAEVGLKNSVDGEQSVDMVAGFDGVVTEVMAIVT